MLVDIPLPTAALRERLEREPVREVLGLVDGCAAFLSRAGDQPWTIRIVFEAWKFPDGEMKRTPLRLHREVTPEQGKAARRLIEAHKVYRARVHVMEPDVDKPGDAWLVSVVREDDSDAKLNALARAMTEPVVYEDSQLGTFLLDRKLKRFEGSADWGSEGVKLTLSAEAGEDAKPALATAHELWAARESWDARVREFTVEELLPEVWWVE